jgi:hypothetical protein
MRRGIRALAVLAAGVVLLPAAPAIAATEKIMFTDGTDRSSWFWNKQVDQEVGAGPISQRLRARSPQNRDTLPVAVERKELERISAIWFDLAGRGVTPGSTITKAVLTIAEISDPNEQPAYNTNGKGIQACPIDEYLAGGEAEEWKAAPKYDESGCVKGKRNAKSKPPAWSFNLTGIAGAWGEDPFGSNNGVMLVPVVPGDAPPIESWQINLKIPNRDVPATPEKENKTTRDRAVLTLAFSPGAPMTLAPPPPPPPPMAPPDFGGGAGTIPSSDFGTESGGGDQGTAPAESETVQAKPVGQVRPPGAPWYVWMLIPLGLLMWAAVRPLVLEPARGMRPDGPVAAIRRLNAQRTGRTLEGPVDPLLGTLHALQGAGRRIAGAARGVRRGLGRAVGGIGALAGTVTRKPGR